MTTNQIPLGSVVVGVDGSEHGDRALDWAARHAELEHRTVAIVHCADTQVVRAGEWVELSGIDRSRLDTALEGAAQQVLAKARARVRATRPGVDTIGIVSHDDARVALTDASARAHLVVLGSRGRGRLASSLLGSVSASVVKHASCAVVVSRPTVARQPRANRVVVGADLAGPGGAALEFAFAEASLRRWPLTIMPSTVEREGSALASELVACHADAPGLEGLRLGMAESLAGLEAKYPDVAVTRDLSCGLVDECVAGRSPAAALLVVGRPLAAGRRWLAHQSAALLVVEHAHTDVVVVPEAGTVGATGPAH